METTTLKQDLIACLIVTFGILAYLAFFSHPICDDQRLINLFLIAIALHNYFNVLTLVKVLIKRDYARTKREIENTFDSQDAPDSKDQE